MARKMCIVVDVKKLDVDKASYTLSIERFGMPIPDAVEFHISEKQHGSMVKAKALLCPEEGPNVTELTMYGNTRRDPEDSFIALFKNGVEIEVKQYLQDSGYINCFDKHTISMTFSFVRGKKVKLDMFYCNDYTELVFETKYFDLPDTFTPNA